MNNVVLHKSTNEVDNSFVGLIIRNDKVYFHYPESYQLSAVDDLRALRRDIINIIRSISLAKTMSLAKNRDNSSASDNENFALVSYLWIIRDYNANGLYKNKEKIYKNNAKGRVNWKRTLQTQPIISNGNVIYNNLVVEVKNDLDDIITEAHKLCVYTSVKNIGWLFGISPKSVPFCKSNETIKRNYINAVKREISKTYDDEKKLRLNHMLKVLSGVDDSDKSKEIVYGVDKYHYVFERMVDSVFSNVDDIREFNPNAQWHLDLSGFKDPIEASYLRPDTIRIVDSDKKIAYVIDAKYYRFGTTGDTSDLPSTTSIQKQITYGNHIDLNMEDISEVRNAFILPYNKENNVFGLSNNLDYIGYADAKWMAETIPHGKIHSFLIDTKHLITSWSQGNVDEDIEALISSIEKSENDAKG